MTFQVFDFQIRLFQARRASVGASGSFGLLHFVRCCLGMYPKLTFIVHLVGFSPT
jgi:hypothetical protein